MATAQVNNMPALAPTTKPVEEERYIRVHLPDMFILFLSKTPAVNPHYEQVRKESEEWVSSECNFDERNRRILSKTDFSFFCSITVPAAGPEELRTVCDWGNWVFPFDDMFDNGSLREDPTRAQELLNSLLDGMNPENAGNHEHPLVKVHNTVWYRIAKTSSAGVRRRFASAMRDYCNGCIEQVYTRSAGKDPTLDEMLALRRQSAGVSPLFALVEYAHKLNLPDYVFESESLKKLEQISIDLVLLQNDVLSYCKEERENVTHNVVAICRRSGMRAQSAFSHIGDMIVARTRDWYLALAELPSWGQDIDSQVQQYLHGLKNVVRANLNWSFRSERYLGKANSEIRKTLTIKVRRQGVDVGPAI